MPEPGSILADSVIEESVQNGDIVIEPWNPKQLNSASYDLTLGSEVTFYKDWIDWDDQWEYFQDTGNRGPRDGTDLTPAFRILDVKKEPQTITWKIDPDKGWVLKPGIGYLLHVRERIWTKKYEPIMDGKSSIGRLFIQVHATAGFGDPNFNGQFTLEVLVAHPIRLYPGMLIGQIRFQTIHGEIKKFYNGNYVGKAALGAVPSRAWKQFQK